VAHLSLTAESLLYHLAGADIDALARSASTPCSASSSSKPPPRCEHSRGGTTWSPRWGAAASPRARSAASAPSSTRNWPPSAAHPRRRGRLPVQLVRRHLPEGARRWPHRQPGRGGRHRRQRDRGLLAWLLPRGSQQAQAS